MINRRPERDADINAHARMPRIGEDIAVDCGEGALIVLSLLDERGVGGAVGDRGAFLNDRCEAVLHQLGADGIHSQFTFARRRSPNSPTLARKLGGTSTVASDCSMTAGPSTCAPASSRLRS